MTTGHLSEIELQQYALDESACAGELREHVAACDNCRTEVMVYRLLLTGIKEEPKAEFSFDVVGLVLSQLPEAGVGAVAPEAAGTEAAPGFAAGLQDALPGVPAREGVAAWSLSTWLQALAFTCTIAIPLFLFRKNIRNLFTEVSVFFMYAIVAAAAVVLFIGMRSLYLKYQKQLRILNYY